MRSKKKRTPVAIIRVGKLHLIRLELPFFSHLAFFAKKRKIGAFFREKMREMRKMRKKNNYFQKWELYAIRTPLAMAIFMLAQAHVTDPLATLLKI